MGITWLTKGDAVVLRSEEPRPNPAIGESIPEKVQALVEIQSSYIYFIAESASLYILNLLVLTVGGRIRSHWLLSSSKEAVEMLNSRH